MNITLQTLTGKKIPLTIEPNIKIQELKAKIHKDIGIRENLSILQGQTVLQPFYSVAFYEIKDGSTLYILMKPKKDIRVTIQTMKLGPISVLTPDTITIQELRKELKTTHQLGRIADLHDICLHDDGDKIEDENLPLNYYNITEGSVLHMRSDETFRVRAISTNLLSTYVPISVHSADTIDELKMKIINGLKMYRNVSDIWNTNDVLLFSKYKETYIEIAPSAHRTVKDYNFKHGDDIYAMKYELNQLFRIRTDRRPIWIHGLDEGNEYLTILTLKLAIQDQLGMPVKSQIITGHNGVVLNNFTLGKYADKLHIAV